MDEPIDNTAAVKARVGVSKAKRAAAALAAELGKLGIEEPALHGDNELTFHYQRKWRFDLAYEAPRVAIEIQGGGWGGGKHHRGGGSRKDYDKGIAAALAGWTLVQVDYAMCKEHDVIGKLAELIKRRLYLASILDESGETL